MLYVPSVTGAFAADLTPGNPDRMNVRYTRGTISDCVPQRAGRGCR